MIRSDVCFQPFFAALRRLPAYLVTAPLLAGALLVAAPMDAGAQQVDLILNVSDAPDPVPAGGVVAYTVRVENDAIATTATGIAVSVAVPAGMRYEGFNGPVGVSCTGMTEGAPGSGTLSCVLPDLAAGDRIEFEFEIELRPVGTGSHLVGFEVAGDQADLEPANNSRQEQTTAADGSDLAVSISDPAVAVADSTVSYNLTVQNHGPSTTAGAIAVQYPIPTGFVLTNGLPGGCSQAGGVITCNVPGPIVSGESRGVGPFTGQVTAASPSSVTHTASVISNQDPVAENNATAFPVTVSSGSDVRLTKARSRAGPYFVGETMSFVLTPSFTGDVPYGLEVVDHVPSNYTIRTEDFEAVQGAWSCGISEKTVTCTRTSTGLLPGHDQPLGPITIPVTIAVAASGVRNTASISAGEPNDPNPDNNTASDTPANLQLPNADLSISKTTPSPALAVVGVDFNFTITPRNNGPMAFYGTLVVTDRVPEGLTITAVSGSGWSCTPTLPLEGEADLVCQRTYTSGAPLAANTNAQAIVLAARASSPGPIVNRAEVSSVGANVLDENLDNNVSSSTVTSSVGADAADLRVIKTVIGPDPVPAGEVLTYRIELVNAGPVAATSVTMTDTLSSLINNQAGANNGFVGITFASPGLSCTSAVAGGSGRLVTCTIPSIPVCVEGDDCPYATVAVRPLIATSGSRTNRARAFSAVTADPDRANNLTSVSSQVEARADISITKNGTPNPTLAGQELIYVLTATNNGPSTAAGVAVVDSLPAGVLFVSASPSSGSCTTTPTAGTVTEPGNRVVACTLGSITRGAQSNVVIRVRPTYPTYGQSIENVARVSTTTIEPTAPGDTNNRAAFTSSVESPEVDLVVNKIDLVDPVTVGDTTAYRVIVANNGPSDAENVSIMDDLPAAGLSYQSHTITSGACVTVPAVNAVGGQLVCQVERLAAGRADTLVVRMFALEKGVRANVVTVSSDESEDGFETNLDNNFATENTTVRTRVDLQLVSKLASADPVAVRVPFTWRLVVRNNSGPGLAEADNVQVSDNLPAGMELTGPVTITDVTGGSISESLCIGAAGDTSFSCQLGTVDNGTEVTILVPVRVLVVPSAPGSISNTVTVSSAASQDINPGNNSATGTTTIVGSSVSGTVFRDFNGNTAIDAGDTGVSGVSMTLTGTAFDGSAVSATTTTVAGGGYTFDGLPAGEYTVSERAG